MDPHRAAPCIIASLLFCAALAQHGTAHGWLNALIFVPVGDATTFTFPPLTVGWTLSFEVTFYLLIAAAVVLGLRRRPVIAAAVLVAAGMVGLFWTPGQFILAWLTNPILLEFALGVGAYMVWERGGVLPGQARRALGVLAGIVLIIELVRGFGSISEDQLIVGSQLSGRRVLLWRLPSAAIFMALLQTRTSDLTPIGRLLRVLGDASFSICLMHKTALVLIGRALNHSPVSSGGLADITLVGSLVVATACGVAYYFWVGRPLTARLRHAYANRPGRLGIRREHLDGAVSILSRLGPARIGSSA